MSGDFQIYGIFTNMSVQPETMCPSLKRDSLYFYIGDIPILYTRLNQLKEILVSPKVY